MQVTVAATARGRLLCPFSESLHTTVAGAFLASSETVFEPVMRLASSIAS